MFQVVISDYGPHVAGYLQVFNPLGERVLLTRPFTGEAIIQHLMLGEDRILCLSATGKMAIFDLTAGKYLATGRVPQGYTGKLAYLHEREMVALWNSEVMLFFDVRTLDYVTGFDGAIWDGKEGTLVEVEIKADTSGLAQTEEVARDPAWRPLHLSGFLVESIDGRVSAGYHYAESRYREGDRPDGLMVPEDPADRYGVYDINPRARMIRRSEVNRTIDADSAEPMIGISPCGRFAVRMNTSRLIRAEGSKDGLMSRMFKGDQPRHRDIQPDGMPRYAVEIDIWALAPLQLVRTVPVGWFPVHSKLLDSRFAALAKQKGEGSDPQVFCLNEAVPGVSDPKNLARSWAEFRSVIPLDTLHWEDDSLAFWLSTANGLVRRVGLDGTVSPYVVFERFAQLKDWPFDAAKAEGGISREMLEVQRSDRTVRVETGTGVLRFDTELLDAEAPFAVVPANGDGYDEEGARAITGEEVFDLVTHPILLENLAEDDANEAFSNLSLELSDGIDRFLRGPAGYPGFEFGFIGDGRRLYEYELFGQADAEGWKLATTLKPLMQIWLAGYQDYIARMGRFCPIAGPSDPNDGQIIPAMALAMRHLILEDPKSLDMFRLFLALRDGPNDAVATDLIGMEYFERNEFRLERDVAFGIYFAMVRNRDGRGPMNVLWNEHGTLGGAYEFLRPDEFAALALKEIRTDHPGLEVSDEMKDLLIDSLIETLTEDPSWGMKASEKLAELRLVPPETPPEPEASRQEAGEDSEAAGNRGGEEDNGDEGLVRAVS